MAASSFSRGLGRRHAPDRRDHRFLLSSVVPAATAIKYKAWHGNRYHLDQGRSPRCVAYSWTHFLVDSPTTHVLEKLPFTVDRLYDEAQRNDEWDGEGYDGTSVRAGAKVLQAAGLIGEYRWAFDLDTVVNCVLTQGPVLLGTNWYERMFQADARHEIHIGGDVAGGHAYKLDAVNTISGRARIKNSWGTGWARNGYAYMNFDTLDRLIHEDGEACMALEV